MLLEAKQKAMRERMSRRPYNPEPARPIANPAGPRPQAEYLSLPDIQRQLQISAKHCRKLFRNLPGVVDLSLGGKKQVRVPRAVFQDFLESRKVQPTG